jgi:hypothetical protein
MPGLTPGRRWQPAYSPFKKEKLGDRALQVLEYSVKGPLFGCRMCGNCLLQETALICPMECPKGLRNGPCGGSTSEYCYVDKTRPCIWYKIYERSFQFGREEQLLEVLPPLDWEKVGQDSWRDVFRSLAKVGDGKAHRAGFLVRWLAAWYEPALRWAMRRAKTVLVAAALATAASLGLARTFGTSFLPEFNEGTFTVFLMAPPGTSLNESNRLAVGVDAQLAGIPGVRAVVRRTGRAERDEHAEPVSSSEIEVSIEPGHDKHDVRRAIDRDATWSG